MADGRLTTARGLVEYALHLRQNGEHAPGGNETWRTWSLAAETFLLSLPTGGWRREFAEEIEQAGTAGQVIVSVEHLKAVLAETPAPASREGDRLPEGWRPNDWVASANGACYRRDGMGGWRYGDEFVPESVIVDPVLVIRDRRVVVGNDNNAAVVTACAAIITNHAVGCQCDECADLRSTGLPDWVEARAALAAASQGGGGLAEGDRALLAEARQTITKGNFGLHKVALMTRLADALEATAAAPPAETGGGGLPLAVQVFLGSVQQVAYGHPDDPDVDLVVQRRDLDALRAALDAAAGPGGGLDREAAVAVVHSRLHAPARCLKSDYEPCTLRGDARMIVADLVTGPLAPLLTGGGAP